MCTYTRIDGWKKGNIRKCTRKVFLKFFVTFQIFVKTAPAILSVETRTFSPVKMSGRQKNRWGKIRIEPVRMERYKQWNL